VYHFFHSETVTQAHGFTFETQATFLTNIAM